MLHIMRTIWYLCMLHTICILKHNEMILDHKYATDIQREV